MDTVTQMNKAKITWKAEEIKIPIDGEKKTFALNRSTMEVFDLESFKQAQEFGSEPVKVGDLIHIEDSRGNQQVTKIHVTLFQYYKNDGTLFSSIDSRADGKIKEVICTKIE